MKFDVDNTIPMAFSMGRKGIVVYEATHRDAIEWDYETNDDGFAIPIKKEKPIDEKNFVMTKALKMIFSVSDKATEDDKATVTVDDDKKTKPKKKKKAKLNHGEPSLYFDINQRKKYKKTRRKMINLCHNNFDENNSIFITLTFDAKKYPQKDFNNLETARDEFRKFIKRMNDHYDNFRHVTVYARQKNGRWHFHMLCNLVTYKLLEEIWGLGGCTITKLRNIEIFAEKIGYLCKNLKNNFNEYVDKCAFMYSKGLQDNIYLRQWKLEESNVIDEVIDLVRSGHINVKRMGDSFYLYGSLEKYWKPFVMATPQKTKFKHKKYRPVKKTKKNSNTPK